MIKILSVPQIRELDKKTIEQKGMTSLRLMENAAEAFTERLVSDFPVFPDSFIHILCGTGNNGGDGLAVARMLHSMNYRVRPYILRISDSESKDFTANAKRARKLFGKIKEVKTEEDLSGIKEGDIVIDAVFGTGLSRPLDKKWRDLLRVASTKGFTQISIDIPSGLFADKHTPETGFQAEFTVSFGHPKLAFMMPENQDEKGSWMVQGIGLDTQAIADAETNNYFIQSDDVRGMLHDRSLHDHKGTYGHALIIAGSYGKVGAAVLSSKAALRTGAGLVTVHTPKCGYQILQISFPEAMVQPDQHEFLFSAHEDLSPYAAVGIGPGLGTNEVTVAAFEQFLKAVKQPLVIDADALNILAKNKKLFNLVPQNSILTPHPGECRRLFGETKDSFERLELLREEAQKRKIFIILKGGITTVLTPAGSAYFCSVGNPGMATGGTGDVLTGILTGLSAQGYTPIESCLLGVQLHGKAGDIAAEETEQEALLASDVIACIGKAYAELRKDEDDADIFEGDFFEEL